MEWLAAWLKQLIAVVLLASLADLLLPGRSMQRYVRLVAGLFVLLALLTPILEWVRGDFAGRILDGLERIVRQPDGAQAELQRIRSEGEKLRREREDQARLLAAERLRVAVREAVERTEGRRVEDVEIDFMEGFTGALEVADVRIVLAPAVVRSEASGADVRPIAAVDPVAPVEVRIEPVRPVTPGEQEAAGGRAADGTGGGATDETYGMAADEAGSAAERAAAASASGRIVRADPAAEARVAALLAARFGIPPETVRMWEMRPRQPEAERR
ncbi:MAG TPA: stage III sporulation protein AF [Paenibacillaceae bacterium]